MKIRTLHDLFVHKIQSIYDAETQIIEAMPTIIDLTSDKKLKEKLRLHLEETEKQKAKLEKLSDDLEIELEGYSNLAMEGMIDSNLELLQNNETSPILDAAIISGSQMIEHFEIAEYGTACEWAELMGHESAKEILGEILEEEKATDELLTKLAKEINSQSMQMAGSIPMGRMG